jgi:hypothetical protein
MFIKPIHQINCVNCSVLPKWLTVAKEGIRNVRFGNLSEGMGNGGIAPSILIWALDGAMWSASRSGLFTPRKSPRVPIG